MVGIRQMLNLIWSKEKGIKEAVVDAYKRLYIPTEGNERYASNVPPLGSWKLPGRGYQPVLFVLVNSVCESQSVSAGRSVV